MAMMAHRVTNRRIVAFRVTVIDISIVFVLWFFAVRRKRKFDDKVEGAMQHSKDFLPFIYFLLFAWAMRHCARWVFNCGIVRHV